jgi:hypothetical protein
MLLFHVLAPPSPTAKVTPAKRMKEHLFPMIRTFKQRHNIDIPYISYLEQVITYESNSLAANYSTNIQQHFVQKLQSYINSMIIKRRLQTITKAQAQASARRIKRLIVEQVQVLNSTLNERNFATRVLQWISLPQINVSLPYDLKANPLAVFPIILTSLVLGFIQTLVSFIRG